MNTLYNVPSVHPLRIWISPIIQHGTKKIINILRLLRLFLQIQRPGSLAAMEQGRRPQRNSGQVHPIVMLYPFSQLRSWLLLEESHIEPLFL